MNAAKMSSKRLQRVARVLSDMRSHSTLAIAIHANACAVNSCVAELRQLGWDIDCKKRMTRTGFVWYYTARKIPLAYLKQVR